MRFSRAGRSLLMVAVLLVAACAPALSATTTPEPMAYCEAQDVKDAYDQEELASITGDADRQTVDDSKITEAIDDYGAHMEQHVRMQHPDNPFDKTHEFLNGINVEGAFLTLMKRTPGMGGEDVRRDLKRLDKILMRIAKGTLDLMDQSEIDSAPSDPLTPSDLIQQRGTRDGDHFGLHRDLPDWLTA